MRLQLLPSSSVTGAETKPRAKVVLGRGKMKQSEVLEQGKTMNIFELGFSFPFVPYNL